jgi:hypothetical protein
MLEKNIRLILQEKMEVLNKLDYGAYIQSIINQYDVSRTTLYDTVSDLLKSCLSNGSVNTFQRTSVSQFIVRGIVYERRRVVSLTLREPLVPFEHLEQTSPSKFFLLHPEFLRNVPVINIMKDYQNLKSKSSLLRNLTRISLYVCIYIYIERERERETSVPYQLNEFARTPTKRSTNERIFHRERLSYEL